MPYKKVSKRPILLLEILIAIALITLGILPMLAPFVRIYQIERNQVQEIQAAHALANLHVAFIEQLHKQEIAWDDLTGANIVEISNDFLNRLNYKAFRWITINKKKPVKAPVFFLLNIDYLLMPSNIEANPSELFQSESLQAGILKTHYLLFASIQKQQSKPPENEDEEEGEEESDGRGRRK